MIVIILGLLFSAIANVWFVKTNVNFNVSAGRRLQLCGYTNDGDCDDGGPGAEFAFCAYGTDPDCGTRTGAAPSSPGSNPFSGGSGISGGFGIGGVSAGWTWGIGACACPSLPCTKGSPLRALRKLHQLRRLHQLRTKGSPLRVHTKVALLSPRFFEALCPQYRVHSELEPHPHSNPDFTPHRQASTSARR